MMNSETFIGRLNLDAAKSHYQLRLDLGERMRAMLDAEECEQYADLALGISDHRGNYSAHEHRLGHRVLDARPPRVIFDLGIRLKESTQQREMLRCIYEAAIPHLKISVGSEMAMLLCPSTFWVANVRTVWTHLLVKYSFDLKIAREALELYRDSDDTSEMSYKRWQAIYLEMPLSINTIVETTNSIAAARGIPPGDKKNLWFDAIANEIYEEYS